MYKVYPCDVNGTDNWYTRFLNWCIEAINEWCDQMTLGAFCTSVLNVVCGWKKREKSWKEKHHNSQAKPSQVISINWKGRENHVVNKTVYISIGLWHRSVFHMHTYRKESVLCLLVCTCFSTYVGSMKYVYKSSLFARKYSSISLASPKRCFVCDTLCLLPHNFPAINHILDEFIRVCVSGWVIFTGC